MTTATQPDAFGALARALGILKDNGDTNTAWFGDPVGTGANAHGLQDILRDDAQRTALLGFVDEVLGDPDRETRGDATWVPLFREPDAHVTIYAVVRAVADAVHVGIGVEHAMDTTVAPYVSTRIHVPVLRTQRGTTPLPADGVSLPEWLLLGRAGGRIDVSLDLVLTTDAPAPREPSLGGLQVDLGIPTDGTANLHLAMSLRDLQLPGATATRTITLDAATPEELGSEVLELLATLVRAQVDAFGTSLPPNVMGLMGLLGLRDVAGLPALPLGEIPTRGLDAIVGWLRDVFNADAARTAWFSQLAAVIGGTVDAGARSASLAIGSAVKLSIGVTTSTGANGALVVVPQLALSLTTVPGAKVRIAVDLLRADLSTGAVTAIPDLRAEALFGTQADSGTPILSGTPAVGGLRCGFVLRDRQPAFTLTLHDVTITGGRTYALLDLSSPGEASRALDSVVSDTLSTVLDQFGAAGDLLGGVLGIVPPAGVTGIDFPRLLQDPIAELREYWQRLTSNGAATASVLGALRALIAGVPHVDVPGLGTQASPWRVELAAPLILLAWRDGQDLVVDAALDISTPVLDDHLVVTTLRASLLRVGFTPVAVTFVGGVSAQVALRKAADAVPLTLRAGPVSLAANAVRVSAAWTPSRGFLVDVEVPDGTVTLDLPTAQTMFALPLPVRDVNGLLTLPDTLWPDVQALIVALASEARSPVVDELLLLVGWTGDTVSLPLATLVAGDPAQAIRTWLATLLLDCRRSRVAMDLLARLLSGGSVSEARGLGSAASPYRAAIAGDLRAPALIAWLDPACPPQRTGDKNVPALRADDVPEDGATLAARLTMAAPDLPDLADLLTSRDGLGVGFAQLIARWTDTDGILPVNDALPDGVLQVQLPEHSYDDLVADGAAGLLNEQLFATVPATIIHVGCEALWRTAFASAQTIDATGASQVGSLTATGTGAWGIVLPDIAASRAARSDRDAVAEQATRLTRALAGRTAPVALVAYGPCAAAAMRVAAAQTAVSSIATVGAPWGTVSVEAFRSGLSADALRVAERLLRADAVPLPLSERALAATPLEVMRDVVTHALRIAADDGALPSARVDSLRAGLACTAAFGVLSEDTICTGLGALLDDGIASRYERAIAARGPGEVEHTALHLGVDVPVLAATIGGVRFGLGASFNLTALERDAVTALEVTTPRSVTVRLQLSVPDGWLVGGPSPQASDVDVRWLEARVTVPFDGSAGDTEFVLHEATGLGSFRERWVVRADAVGDAIATQALPEVRAMLAGVVLRLRAASPDVAMLLDLLGVIRNDGPGAVGLDAVGFDRLLFEPGLVAARVKARAVEFATSMRALVPGLAGSGSRLEWTTNGATLSLDAATRSFSASVTTSIGGTVPFTVSAALGADGKATASFALGALDANAGGLRLLGTAGAVNGVQLEWGTVGPGTTRTMALLPTPDVSQLSRLATTVLPAYVTQLLVSAVREAADDAAHAAFDAALDALALLEPAATPGAIRRMRLPLALFDDTAAWLQHGAESWRTNPVGSAVQLLDALVPIVAPARGSAAGWPIVPGVVVNYSGAGGRLLLSLAADLTATVDTHPIVTRLRGGISIGNDGRVSPALEVGVSVDGVGLQLAVSPSVELSLVRRPPAALLRLYPEGPGLATIFAAIATSALPQVLNALAAKRTLVTQSLTRDVARAIFDIGTALDLVEADAFTNDKLLLFADNPAARLLARLPNLVSLGAATLARALDPAETVVRVLGPTGGVVTLQFGSARQVRLSLDGSTPGVPVVRLAATLTLAGVGTIDLEDLRLAPDGVSIAVRVVPVALLVGGVTLRPVLTVRAGVGGSGFTRMAGLALALDDASLKRLELRWGLDATPPSVVVVTRTETAPGIFTDAVNDALDRVAIALLSIATNIASGLAMPVLLPKLPAQAITALDHVLLVPSGVTHVLDTTLFDDLLQPEHLFTRLKRLAYNLATLTPSLSITIDGVVTISLKSDDIGTPASPKKRLGVSLTLGGTGEYVIPGSSDPKVTIRADASWITGSPVAPGLTLHLFEGHVTTTDVLIDLVPGFTIGGVGVAITKDGGPLLNVGPVSLDGVGVYLFGEIVSAGIGAGVLVELTGLAIAPGGAGGNPVAGNILSDAARGGSNTRAAFSPAVAVQARAGGNVGVSVRAGPPPGPWWLVVQRELGPLYLEQIGFDSQTTDGAITRVQLLFDGRVSLFGLTAAVDRLSLTWSGGDLLDLSKWNADLMGLAISADFSGVTLAGGLLKDENGGYLGMLLGRFGTYGLTVYGGYAVINQQPSFFIFGALNGPIGGPPAFFITGIGAGLGINRQLRVPDNFDGFKDYPFIKALDVSAEVGDPMVELRKLNGYFAPQPGQFWVAAGISFTCFALVDGIAVVAVAFGSDGLDINLLGLARMALPRPQLPLVSIELGLIARFSTREGIFSIRAQLTENSWLLYPEVRLTGGFAFVVWWKGPLKGQFVLTIGGYHPRFHRDGYPDVPRVGLVWQVSDAIVIKGGAYFALTSEALMAGLEVTVSADFGWAWARIEFGANGIVYFDPFWFEVEAYAMISAGVKIETWLGTLRFSISTGASLLVSGPEFGGKASFHVGPAKVTVPFGSQAGRAGDAIDWPAFVGKYLEAGPLGGARALSAITGLGSLTRKATKDNGASADGTKDRPFEVFGEFEFAITSTVPFEHVVLGPSNAQTGLKATRSDGTPASLGLAPMKVDTFTSTLTLNIVGTSSEPGVAGAKPGVLDGNVETIQFDLEAFPIGAWGPTQPATVKPIPQGDVLFAMNRVRFNLRTVQPNSPLPALQYRRVKKPVGRELLPLQALGGERPAMFTAAAAVALPAPTTAAAALVQASQLLFTPPRAKPPKGMLARGTPGAMAKAAYAGDRVAPPMFGTLADGLRKTNAADGASLPMAAAPQPQPAQPRAPKLAGLLAGGAGVIERGPATSVSDGRLKRRPAPTVETVRSRLTRVLPVQLARTARPGVSAEGTLIPAGVTPFTAAPGTARSLAVGRTLAPSALGELVGGLTPALRGRSKAPPQSLHAGDMVVLRAPDHGIDLDVARRPVVQVSGQARVTVTTATGTVLADATVTERLEVPPRAALIAVQAAGDATVRDGLAGWHERTRMARISGDVALGPGCTLQIEGVVSEAPPAWITAGEMLTQATVVTTRFTGAVTTLAIVLAGSDTPDTTTVSLELDGATRVVSKGVPKPPRVVMSGPRAVLLYEVKPQRTAACAVRVQAGGQWTLMGVLGGDTDAATLARSLASKGVAALTARLLVAADGTPVAVTWQAPDAQRGTPSPRKAAARTTAARKTSARKTAAKKTSRSAAKQATRKTVKKSVKKTVKKGTKQPARTTTSRRGARNA